MAAEDFIIKLEVGIKKKKDKKFSLKNKIDIRSICGK